MLKHPENFTSHFLLEKKIIKKNLYSNEIFKITMPSHFKNTNSVEIFKLVYDIFSGFKRLVTPISVCTVL